MLRSVIAVMALLLAGPVFSDENVTVACATNADCAATDFCSREAGGSCDAAGQCVPRGINVMCMTTCDAVCGCDGKTYLNACYAHKAGASVAESGTCP